ncbi:MAG TPA: hypothetical protein VHU92_08760 [Streptosporangiaceae bacterium]|nr:hypothetical protein [Streptosporangiaceae bacterium]
MPDSLVAQLVTSAWDKISEAVSQGLAAGQHRQQALADVVPVVTRPLGPVAWQPGLHQEAAGGCRRVRTTADGRALDYRFRFPLDHDMLRSPDADRITTWANEARRFELQHTLGRLARLSLARDFPPGILSRATVGGWGELRCLVVSEARTDLIPPGWDTRSLDLPPLPRQSPPQPVQALLFRVGGGPYLQRPADLQLGWLPAGYDGADLVLTEQLQIVNAGPSTILGIRMVAR